MDTDNLLLFFSGNEVINARNNTNAAPYIKAVTRDMRQYISAQADRQIPVGYSSADVAENIEQQANYVSFPREHVVLGLRMHVKGRVYANPKALQALNRVTRQDRG